MVGIYLRISLLIQETEVDQTVVSSEHSDSESKEALAPEGVKVMLDDIFLRVKGEKLVSAPSIVFCFSSELLSHVRHSLDVIDSNMLRRRSLTAGAVSSRSLEKESSLSMKDESLLASVMVQVSHFASSCVCSLCSRMSSAEY